MYIPPGRVEKASGGAAFTAADWMVGSPTTPEGSCMVR